DHEQDRDDHDDVARDGKRRGDGAALVHAVAPFRPTTDEMPETTNTRTVMMMAVADAHTQSSVTLEEVKSCVDSMRLPDPPSRYGVVYAVTDPANTSVAATTIPGSDRGRTTSRKVRPRLAPNPRAASSRPGSTCVTAE